MIGRRGGPDRGTRSLLQPWPGMGFNSFDNREAGPRFCRVLPWSGHGLVGTRVSSEPPADESGT